MISKSIRQRRRKYNLDLGYIYWHGIQDLIYGLMYKRTVNNLLGWLIIIWLKSCPESMAYFDVSYMKETEGSRMQEVLTTLLYSVWSATPNHTFWGDMENTPFAKSLIY